MRYLGSAMSFFRARMRCTDASTRAKERCPDDTACSRSASAAWKSVGVVTIAMSAPASTAFTTACGPAVADVADGAGIQAVGNDDALEPHRPQVAVSGPIHRGGSAAPGGFGHVAHHHDGNAGADRLFEREEIVLRQLGDHRVARWVDVGVAVGVPEAGEVLRHGDDAAISQTGGEGEAIDRGDLGVLVEGPLVLVVDRVVGTRGIEHRRKVHVDAERQHRRALAGHQYPDLMGRHRLGHLPGPGNRPDHVGQAGDPPALLVGGGEKRRGRIVLELGEAGLDRGPRPRRRQTEEHHSAGTVFHRCCRRRDVGEVPTDHDQLREKAGLGPAVQKGRGRRGQLGRRRGQLGRRRGRRGRGGGLGRGAGKRRRRGRPRGARRTRSAACREEGDAGGNDQPSRPARALQWPSHVSTVHAIASAVGSPLTCAPLSGGRASGVAERQGATSP